MKTNYPDSVTIQQYLEGKLDPELMHQLEKQALEDPFLWEALEGYTNTTDAGRGLSILQRQLHERIVHLQENKKVFDLTWQRLSVAAAAAVLFIAAGILFWMNSNIPNTEMASNQKQVEVMLTDPDSLNSIISIPDSGTKSYASAKEQQSQTVRGNYTVASAQPQAGWDLYLKYLELNIRRPKNKPDLNGTVVVSLQVDKDGKTGNFKILKGLTDAYNTEAIRLIKEGPAWKGANDGKTKDISVEVVF